MKKVLWVLALVLVSASIPSAGFAADISNAQQDDAFLSRLAEQAQEPASPALTEAPLQALRAGSCINLHCGQDSDCWPHCGGEGASYCAYGAYRRCVPY